MAEFNYMYVETVQDGNPATVGVIVATASDIKFFATHNAPAGESELWSERLQNARSRGFAIPDIIEYFEGYGNMATVAVSMRRVIIAKSIEEAARSAIARSNTVKTKLS